MTVLFEGRVVLLLIFGKLLTLKKEGLKVETCTWLSSH